MSESVRFDSRGNDGVGWDATLVRPCAVYAADDLVDVRNVLALAYTAALEGYWAAVVVTYEAAAAFDSAMRTRPAIAGLPLAWAAIYEDSPEHLLTPTPWDSRGLAGRASVEPSLDLTPSMTRGAFGRRVRAAQKHIRAGNTYQVNLTFPLHAPAPAGLPNLYQSLLYAQDAPYCAALDLGRYVILSLSPELFFARTGSDLVMRPMKGTVQRGRWLEEDRALAARLRASAKERAENVMIVDLLRSDAGRLALTGSVRTPELFTVRRYPTLWQMTSTVTATLPESTTLVDIFTALFPCGSVTGAPKIRTMDLITDLETAPRGVYTGAIGLLRPGGHCTFNVAIRTLLIDRAVGVARLDVGSGVTIDSDPDEEYTECLLKAAFATRQASRQAVPFSLMETMRLERGVVLRLERHLARMQRSAEYFGYAWNDRTVRDTLEGARAQHTAGCWRLRLLLDAQGVPSATCVPHQEGAARIWRVAFSSAPINERSPFLFNKTTRRDVYDAARRERPELDDVLLWNSRGHVTESTIANVVLEIDGTRVTPPVTSGLLPGVARGEWLDRGEIIERVVTKGDVANASRLWLLNSLRGFVKAELVSPSAM